MTGLPALSRKLYSKPVSLPGHRDRRRGPAGGSSGQGSDQDDPDCIRRRFRPGKERLGRKPRSPRGNVTGNQGLTIELDAGPACLP